MMATSFAGFFCFFFWFLGFFCPYYCSLIRASIEKILQKDLVYNRARHEESMVLPQFRNAELFLGDISMPIP